MKTKIQKFAKLLMLVFGLAICGYAFSQNPLPMFNVAQASDGGKKVLSATTRSGDVSIKVYLAASPLTVTFENKRWVASQNEIRSWLTTKNNGTVVTAADPSSFVGRIASEVFVPATGDRDGRAADTANLSNQIKDTLKAGTGKKTIALVTVAVPRNANAQAGRYSGHYIDINLSEQKLYAFDNVTLVNEFLVSTGRRGFATPTGEFRVYGQDRSAKMSGPGYYLPHVPYISWFHGDYSIHGTYWHHNFGHVMSHGCVNMETSNAEWVYSFVGIGTPVYIHY